MKRILFITISMLLISGLLSLVYGEKIACRATEDCPNGYICHNGECVTGTGEAPSCYSGGPGAVACSIAAGTEIIGVGVSYGCSVECAEGYYACCSITCTCISSY